MTESSWQEIAKIAQEYRDASIARVEPAVPEVPRELPRDVMLIPAELLDKEEVEITQTTTEDLLASIASGRLTSAAVTKAFLRRAGLAQRLVCPTAQGVCVSSDLEPIADQLYHRTTS